VLAVADGALCYVGALSDAHGHHHVATQFVRAWAGSFELADGHNNRVVTSAAIIPSGCDHSIRILKPVVSGVLVFVDPASPVASHVAKLVRSSDDAGQWAEAGQALSWVEPLMLDPASILRGITDAQRQDDRPGREAWHPSVRKAVELVPELLPERVDLSTIARAVALSPSRLSRLFNDQVGQSFPTYVRWVRLRLAVEALQRGLSLTDAAHAAGFTDSAHANRVCHEMFGLSPTQASRNLVWA
jgi:AraC-like DNA-binding protein